MNILEVFRKTFKVKQPKNNAAPFGNVQDEGH